MIFEAVFTISVAVIAYGCVGYPIFIALLSRVRTRDVRRDDITPAVSVIIAAHNEEQAIAAKLERTLGLDYPADKLEIIVGSDYSTDRTDEIVRRYVNRGVILHRQNQRLGKTVVQNSAAQVSTGDVLVFTDATTDYPRDALRKLVRPFADDRVGCVSSRLIYIDPKNSSIGKGCRSYWSYEEFLRQSESRVGSMIGVTGCFYAVRRRNYRPLDHNMCSDFVIASEIRLQGLRTIYEAEALSFEDTNDRDRDELRMRVRIIQQTFSAISRYRELMNPFRHGLFAFQLLSHKLARYAVAILLPVIFVSNLLIAEQSVVYRATMVMQLAFYSLAIVGWILSRSRLSIGLLSIPYYITLGQAAVILGLVKFIRGESYIVWDSQRQLTKAKPSINPVNTENTTPSERFIRV